MLERHPEGVEALQGYVWLDMPGKVRHVGEHELEFTTDRRAEWPHAAYCKVECGRSSRPRLVELSSQRSLLALPSVKM